MPALYQRMVWRFNSYMVRLEEGRKKHRLQAPLFQFLYGAIGRKP